ncbi:hypothetical protein Tco_1359401 [Tanacetum coccineum]
MDKDSNIHSDVHFEDQNSPYPNMDKEHLMAEFDGIKATVLIIDNRKGDVGSSCLEKELDVVKERIAMLEKAFKLRVIAQSQMFAIKKWHSNNMTSLVKGNVGFDHMLDSVCKDDLPHDKFQEGLVKLVDMLSMEENISDSKLDEKVDVEVEVDRAMRKASTSPTTMESKMKFVLMFT